MAFQIVKDFSIRARREVVWEYLDDPRAHTLWLGANQRTVLTSPEPIKTGTRFQIITEAGSIRRTEDGEILFHRPVEEIVVRVRQSARKYIDTRYLLAPHGDVTLLTCTVDFAGRGTVTAWFLRLIAIPLFRQSLMRLKKVAEGT
jgi:uncharacterized protein YndB with AHSA1/START domain